MTDMAENVSVKLEEVPPEAAPARKRSTALAVRLWCALVFAICGGMLGLGMWLSPSGTGLETHRQLGLPPCGFYLTTHIPCPTCGCTTAVSHFAHGHILASLVTQPFGFTVAAVGFIAAMLSAVGVVTGRWFGPSVFMLNWHWRLWVYGGIGILLVGWLYKIIIVRMGS